MRIVELLVDEMLFDDQFIGVDGIALVKRPAHEENWLAFSEGKKQPYEVLSEDQMIELAEAMKSLGQTHESIIEDGFELISVTPISSKKVFVGDIMSYPNEVSEKDTVATRTRYKYVGPQDSKNRSYCAAMMSGNMVYRIEDIQRMTQDSANSDFGYYDIFMWRGSFNCRHQWVQLVYQQINKDEDELSNAIRNNAKRSRKNLISTDIIPQEPTITKATANDKGMMSVETFSDDILMAIDVDGLPVFVDESGTTVSEPVVMTGKSKSVFGIDEDKMEITGAAMIPNKMIVRHTVLGEPYYVYFSRDTIKVLSQKFMKDKLTDSTNIEHSNQKAKDTYVVESWLVSDENMDKSKSFGLDYPVGSWVITMKTEDKDIWEMIKKGEYAGFSVEGYFEEKQVFTKDDHILNGIKSILKKI
tara:strand:+ start:16060 stop:17307 length:1248 start_codon:yes stop_codon:yes gene_type:complete